MLIPMEPYSICDFPGNGVQTPFPPSESAHVRDVSRVALSLIIIPNEESQLN